MKRADEIRAAGKNVSDEITASFVKGDVERKDLLFSLALAAFGALMGIAAELAEMNEAHSGAQTHSEHDQ